MNRCCTRTLHLRGLNFSSLLPAASCSSFSDSSANRKLKSKQQQMEMVKEKDKSEWQTVVLSNGVVACWHPPKQFPYEHSRPIELAQVETEKQKFFDRLHNPDKLDKWPYGEEGPADLFLREIFYTNSQEWKPKPREKRLYKSAGPVEQKPLPSNQMDTSPAPAITGEFERQTPALENEKQPKTNTDQIGRREKGKETNK